MNTDIPSIFVQIATKYMLSPQEKLLLASCECAFEVYSEEGLDKIARLCVQSRVTIEQIDAHVGEIKVNKLTKYMVRNVSRFVQYFHLLAKLDIIEFETRMPGRSLLGYSGFKVLQPDRWEALLHFACDKGGMKYFGARSTVYEMLLKFGFKISYFATRRALKKEGKARPVNPDHDPLLSTHKKSQVLEADHFIFDPHTLFKNKKRLCNGQVSSNKLLKLANAAVTLKA